MLMLQQRADANSAMDVFELDRIDRALDQLVAHPTNTQPPHWQVRDARSNAAKVLKERRSHDVYRLDDEALHESHRLEIELVQARDDVSTETFDIVWWINMSPSLTDYQRVILRLLARGEDAVSLATRFGVSVAVMRSRISRVRRAGRVAYQLEMSV